MTPRTRVAVVQLAVHPALLLERRSALENPLFAWKEPDALLPEGGVVPEALQERFDALRERIRKTYCDNLLRRIAAVLAFCRAQRARIVVFPEYSIPWDISREE